MRIEAMKQWLEALEKSQSALAEELSAWDIDPPLHHVQESHDLCGPAITSLRQAIARAEGTLEAEKQEHIRDATKIVSGVKDSLTTQQEHVACQHKRYSIDVHEQTGTCYDCGAEGRMRFVVDDTHPQPKREWVGLTLTDIKELSAAWWEPNENEMALIDWVEVKLKEKNNG